MEIKYVEDPFNGAVTAYVDVTKNVRQVVGLIYYRPEDSKQCLAFSFMNVLLNKAATPPEITGWSDLKFAKAHLEKEFF